MGNGKAPAVKERTIRFHRSILSEAPAVITLLLLTFPGCYYTFRVDWLIQEVTIARGVTVGLPLLGLPWLLILFFILHRRFNFEYSISHDHVGAVSGILSTRLQDIRIEYENIRGVEIDRSLYQRVLGLGDIKVGSAMHSDVEVKMQGVRNPTLYRSIIEARMREHIHRYRPHQLDVQGSRLDGSGTQESTQRRPVTRRKKRKTRKIKKRPAAARRSPELD